jgi:formimidoylglutamase
MVLSHDPNWLRAGNWFKNVDYADFGIVGVGASKSALTPNRSHKTPSAVREALHKYSTYNASSNLDVAELMSAGDFGDIRNPDNQSSAAVQLTEIYQKAKTVVLIGGDNSITFSGVSALFDSYKLEKIGLITLDAHHDLRDGVSNGSPIKQLLDQGLLGKNIVQIGINDFANSKFYADRAKKAGIKVIHRSEFHKNRPEQIAKRALSALAKCSIIYIDIDMDICDRATVPAAPAAMPGGISADQIRSLVRALAKEPRAKLFDITELDATIDSLDQRSVRLAALLILEIAAAKAEKK